MKAIVFYGKCNVKVDENLPLPTLQTSTDVIIKVLKCGLCGSDLHPYHCREVGIEEGKCIMGHEFVGEVIEKGSDVNKIKIGDRVACSFTTCCGECYYCTKGLTARCEKNQLLGWFSNGTGGLQGAQAQYIRVPLADGSLLPLPDYVTDEEGILLGDIFSTGYFCADNAGIKQAVIEDPNTTVAVIGCGPVGLLAVIGAYDLGCRNIYAIDTVPARLQKAVDFGAIAAINASESDAVTLIKNATDGRGADIILEVVGSPSALELALELVRPGGTISSCGCHTQTTVPMVSLYNKNLTIKSGRCSARYYMDKLLPIVQSKKYDLTSIITHRLPLNAEAYEMFDSKADGCIKVVFDPWLETAGEK